MGELLEEYRRASSSLETTKMTLQMAKLIGSLDSETARMSQETAEEACSRLLRSLQPFSVSIKVVAEYGQKCASLASACMANPTKEALNLDPGPAWDLLRSLNKEVIALQRRL